MLPRALLEDEDLGDAVVRWSTLPGDPVAHLDTLRELVVQPWTHIDADGVRLRMAALRSAVERLVAAWSATASSAHAAGAASGDAADVVVLSGGAFAAVPSAAAILALEDDELAARLTEERAAMAAKVAKKSEAAKEKLADLLSG